MTRAASAGVLVAFRVGEMLTGFVPQCRSSTVPQYRTSVSSCLRASLQEVFSRLDPDEMCEALEPGLLAVVGCLPDLKVVGVVSWPPTRGGDPTGRWCQRQHHRLQWADCSQLRAAELGYHKTVDVLLDKGADKYVVVDELGDKPLMVASARGCLSAVKTLIDLKVVGVVLPRNRVIPPSFLCLLVDGFPLWPGGVCCVRSLPAARCTAV